MGQQKHGSQGNEPKDLTEQSSCKWNQAAAPWIPARKEKLEESNWEWSVRMHRI